jgi:hypothetical protein
LSIFFFTIDSTTSPTIIFFVISLIGVIAGMAYMGLLMSFLSKDEDDDEF